jgi:4-hydroxybutyrate dehydrogenase
MQLVDLSADDRIVEMSYPTRVVFGTGALQRLPAQVERLQMRKPLVVADQGIVKSGLLARVLDVLKGSGIAHGIFDRVNPDPTEEDAFDGVAAYRNQNCVGVIAVGGGSPLDTAKLIQLLTTHQPPLSRYDDATGGDRFVRDDLPPLIAIPTTAGTGSEVSRSAVATLKDTGRKTVIFSPHLMPKAAICDPELTVGMPRWLTAATGIDAFTHCLEAYLANALHPLADAVAIDGIGRVGAALEIAVEKGTHLAARGQMMIAAMEGAMAFQKGLGACHALAHALTPISRVHHGLANAIVLPAVLEFNRSACAARLAHVSVALGDNSLTREEMLASNAIERIRGLLTRIGIPQRLRDAGVREADLPLIAKKAFQDASHQTNPRPCTEEDLLGIAKAAF